MLTDRLLWILSDIINVKKEQIIVEYVSYSGGNCDGFIYQLILSVQVAY